MPAPRKSPSPSNDPAEIDCELRLRIDEIRTWAKDTLPSDISLKMSFEFRLGKERYNSLSQLEETRLLHSRLELVVDELDKILPPPKNLPEGWEHGQGYFQHHKANVTKFIDTLATALDNYYPELIVGRPARKLTQFGREVTKLRNTPSTEMPLGKALQKSRINYEVFEKIGQTDSPLVPMVARCLRIDRAYREWGTIGAVAGTGTDRRKAFPIN